MISMTHDNKMKFWFFYAKKDPEEENSSYDLYAFTDKIELATGFMDSRCMNKFYFKSKKIDRMNYNELIRNHLNCELLLYRGYCRLQNSIKPKEFEIPLTKKEEMIVLQRQSIYLHEYLFRYVWDKIGILQDKYLDALVTLGYPMLQTYIYLGDNPISRSVEDALLANDMNIILDEFGWSFREG